MHKSDTTMARITGICRASTPSLDLALEETDGVYIGTSGTLVCYFRDTPTTAVTLNAVAAGMWHPLKVVKIGGASTAAGILVGYCTSAGRA